MMETNKKKLVEQLKLTPIVQIACKKVGVGRATYYRWRKADQKFSEAVDIALKEGADIVTDLAESKLITAIKDGSMTGIMFWLKNHHRQYSNKIETTVSNSVELTEEQKSLIENSLAMFFDAHNNKEDKNE